MRRAILFALAPALLGSTDAAAQAFDSLIAAGIYPPAVKDVAYIRPDIGLALIARLDSDSLEWVGCLYGSYNPADGTVRIERYYEPRQVERKPDGAEAELCPGIAIGRIHPHLGGPNDMTCYWPLGDMMSFKSAVSYQGYSFLVEAIICHNEDGVPVIAFFGWGELAEFESRVMQVPFYYRHELGEMLERIRQGQ